MIKFFLSWQNHPISTILSISTNKPTYFDLLALDPRDTILNKDIDRAFKKRVRDTRIEKYVATIQDELQRKQLRDSYLKILTMAADRLKL